MSSFSEYNNRQEEMTMLEKLTERIGDMVPNTNVNLEGLCERKIPTLKALYRFMTENPTLELASIDDAMVSFRFFDCGHEFPLPWVGLEETVSSLIKSNKIKVCCGICQKEKEEKVSSGEKKPKNITLTQSDLDNAQHLAFMFLQPLEEQKLTNRQQDQAKKLGKRLEIRLQAYQKACAAGDKVQAKNAGLALKNGIVFMRRELGIACAVKFQN